jgi:hypothetical protein
MIVEEKTIERVETKVGVKSGWRTTEFWLATMATVLGVVYASGFITDGSQMDKVLGIAASVLATLGYSVSRGLAKV